MGRSQPRRRGLWHSATRWRPASLWWPLPDLSDVFDVDLGGDDDLDDRQADDDDQLQREVDDYLDAIAADHLDNPIHVDDLGILTIAAAASVVDDVVVGGAAPVRSVDDRADNAGADVHTGDTTFDHVARDAVIATALAEFTIGAAFIGGTIVGAAMTLALLKIVTRWTAPERRGPSDPS